MLIQAFALISHQYPDEKLIIFGEGPLKNELKQYVSEMGLDQRVIFPGAISDVNVELSKSKVFVLSSDYEGLPNALMEAMASGVAVVSTDCPSGGPKYLLKESNAGILVPCNNADEMAQAISIMMDEKKNDYFRDQAKKKQKNFCRKRFLLNGKTFCLKRSKLSFF